MLDRGKLRGCIDTGAARDDQSIAPELACVAGKFGALEERQIIARYAAWEFAGSAEPKSAIPPLQCDLAAGRIIHDLHGVELGQPVAQVRAGGISASVRPRPGARSRTSRWRKRSGGRDIMIPIGRTKIPGHCKRFRRIQGGHPPLTPSAARGNATRTAEFPLLRLGILQQQRSQQHA
jgi:hypothetical protein